MSKLKRNELSGSPCFTPIFISNSFGMLSPKSILALVFLYKFSIVLNLKQVFIDELIHSIHHFNEKPRFGNYSKFFHMKF